MNHLAHVHLSGADPAVLVGNLAADYLRKRECLDLPIELQAGVELHRLIDYSTDNHPAVRRAWALLRPRHGKYAPVIFDIYGDYLLTTRWRDFATRPLPEVSEGAYRSIRAHRYILPGVLAARFERMIDADWLRQYGSYEGQAYVFERFGQRLSKPQLLDGVIDTLRTNETALAAAFAEFYPWMLARAHWYRVNQAGRREP